MPIPITWFYECNPEFGGGGGGNLDRILNNLLTYYLPDNT